MRVDYRMLRSIKRESQAFNNFYGFAKRNKVSDPKRRAERAAKRIHRLKSAR